MHRSRVILIWQYFLNLKSASGISKYVWLNFLLNNFVKHNFFFQSGKKRKKSMSKIFQNASIHRKTKTFFLPIPLLLRKNYVVKKFFFLPK